MARTSQAKGAETMPARQRKVSVKRAPERQEPSQAAIAATHLEPQQPPEPEPVATAAPPPEGPESRPALEAAVSTPAEAGALETESAVQPAVPIADAEPRPVPEVPTPERGEGLRVPLPLPGQAPDLAAMLGASRTLVEGSLRARSQMIGFSCRQAGHGLAVGRAMLASGSVPAALALQARYLGEAFDDALAQTLELSRLSTDLVRAGLQSLRPHQA